jgi:cytochrome c-type biogenesis protein CcmH/NrfF
MTVPLEPDRDTTTNLVWLLPAVLIAVAATLAAVPAGCRRFPQITNSVP